MKPIFENLNESVINWAKQRGITGKENSRNQFIKTVEETGELASALLKNDREKLIDSLGDVLVTLIILSHNEGLDIVECLESAYNEIKDRKGKTVNGSFIKND